MSRNKKLNNSEKKQVQSAIDKAKNKKKGVKSAQDTIPYTRMFKDGICLVNEKLYTKTIGFTDINYQIAQNEDKTAIFEGWCDFLNYFDSSIKFQLSFINSTATASDYENNISIESQGDDFDSIRIEYAGMLHNQLSRGNNGLVKSKYLTFGVEADSIKIAKPRLERIESDLWNAFKKLGVRVYSLNGKERLKLLHSILRMDGTDNFKFEWEWLVPSGLSTKDYIAPSSFEFRERNSFKTGGKIGTASFLQIIAPELNDRVLSDFLEMESNLVVTMHIQSIDQMKAIRTVKRKLTDLQRIKIEEQKKAVRAGYDMDILPTDLATYGVEANKILADLQSRNERMFLITFTIVNVANDKKELDNIILQANGIANKHNCQLIKLDYQQEQGFMSALPLGQNFIPIQRSLTTSSTAIFVPFTTQELFQSKGEPLYYGLNALSNNLIMVDRKNLKNPKGLYYKRTRGVWTKQVDMLNMIITKNIIPNTFKITGLIAFLLLRRYLYGYKINYSL